MNIENVKDVEKYPKNILQTIYEKQNELAEKYKEIEKMGTLLEDKKINVDTRNGQKWIKDFMWRVTEEIVEALEAFYNEHKTHYLEEITDALHFFTELLIISGYEIKDFNLNKTLISINESEEFNTIYWIGLAANTLKNKSWKQTEILTDREKFKLYLENAFISLLRIYYKENLTNKDIYNLYHKKNTVNKFRIRSKY